jgi:anti-sigma factor (TIGR02949 family)
MSCGDPHDVDCSLILGRLYEYIDNEIDESDCGSIRTHLDECFPCLEKYGLEQTVKELVHRSCGADEVPEDLRSKVLARIQTVRIQVEAGQTVTEVEETVVEVHRSG